MEIIDCTLRDGGYYNNWDFSVPLVNDYLNAVSASGLKFIELGFRNGASLGYRGPLHYSSDEFINNFIEVPDNLEIGVMINSSAFIVNNNANLPKLYSLFQPAANSPVSFVRIASHVSECALSIELASGLLDLGYRVVINVMQYNESLPGARIKSVSDISEKLAGKLESLYFADSLGSMTSADVESTVQEIREAGWQGHLGFHAHDNMSLALANSLVALESGVTWLDCTVTGMGRGAGNLSTEMLLSYFVSGGNEEYSFSPILALIGTHFERLREALLGIR